MTTILPNPDYSARDTEFILKSARDGSEPAWRELYGRYRRMLIISIECKMRGALGRRFDADDVLQEAFAKAWSKMDSFHYEGEGSFRSWLRRIVLNEFNDLLTSTSAATAGDSLDSKIMEAALPVESPASAILSELESKQRVLDSMARLDDDDQDLITMRLFEKKNWEDIGAIIGCTRVLAKKRFDRVIATLARDVN